MNTKTFEQFAAMTEVGLSNVEGGSVEVVGIVLGAAWAIYSFGEAAGRTAYYVTHSK
ncbi:COMC family protein [Streptococcus equinus]|nr:COMC family protein [Streptococcus equinus]